jgi:hypothetical protein
MAQKKPIEKTFLRRLATGFIAQSQLTEKALMLCYVCAIQKACQFSIILEIKAFGGGGNRENGVGLWENIPI